MRALIILATVLWASVAWGHEMEVEPSPIDACWEHCHPEGGGIEVFNHCGVWVDSKRYTSSHDRFINSCSKNETVGGIAVGTWHTPWNSIYPNPYQMTEVPEQQAMYNMMQIKEDGCLQNCGCFYSNVSDDIIKQLAKSGRICEVLGHRWSSYWFTHENNGVYLPIRSHTGELPDDARQCEICNKRQKKVTEWQDVK